MAKSVHDDVLDGALNIIKNNANLMCVCSAQPTTRAEAIATYMLADIAMTAGDFIAADGDAGGRKLTVGTKTDVVTNPGTALFVALVDGSRLLYVTTCTSQALTAGNPITWPAWKITLGDPT
jgi:fructose-specific component phosphotransferase system IIB-like protein